MKIFRIVSVIAAVASAVFAADSLDVTDGQRGMVERYLTGIAEKQWSERAAKVAAMRTPAEVEARQTYIRTKVLKALGGFPQTKSPLNARVTGTLKRDGYHVDKLIYESLPGYYVTANLYVPETGNGPFPAVLGTAGHSAAGKAYSIYQRPFITLAKRGFVVLAYDPPGQGERQEYLDLPEKTGGTGEHTMAGLQCLLTGGNVARYELWDGVRAVDYLLTRTDVDPKRIAVIGNSGGGTQSAYMAVVEPRLAAAVPSCYITSWKKLWSGPGPQDSEQDFADFLKDGLDFPDFLIAFAPKPIQMLTAIKDFFPIDGARDTYAEARRVFGLLGKEDHVGYFEYDDGHGWSKPRREATYAWLEKWLQGREKSSPEPEFEPEPEPVLNCTPTGQVATSLKGKTVQLLNQEVAEDLYVRRTAASLKSAQQLRDLVRTRLDVAIAHGTPKTEAHGQIDRDGYRIEKITIESEPGITIPVLVFVPQHGGRMPAVIVANEAGKAADAGPGGQMEALVRKGYLVVAPDLRGFGESANPTGKSGYKGQFQTAMRAILVGKTMVGMQTYDLLRAFDYVASRPDVNRERISVIGKGSAGVATIFAAALEPRIRKVVAENSLLSYMDLVRMKLHQGMADLIVPGVLRDFDLPDVAKALGNGKLFIVSPRAPNGETASLEDAARQYGSGVRVLKRLDASYPEL